MQATEQELHATSSVDGVSDTEREAPSLLIGVAEAAAALGISRTTTYEMVRQGRFPLPVMRIGNRYRVSRAALRDFIEKGQ